MADSHEQADSPALSPGIENSFLADRQTFWATFVKFTTFAVIAIVLLLIVMRITLV